MVFLKKLRYLLTLSGAKSPAHAKAAFQRKAFFVACRA
jgi:hypothetical protein